MIIASNDSLEGIFQRKWFWCYEWFWLLVMLTLLMLWYSTMLWGFSVLCIFMCYIHCVHTAISSQNICPWYGSYKIQCEMRMDDCLKSDICPNLPFSRGVWVKVFFWVGMGYTFKITIFCVKSKNLVAN